MLRDPKANGVPVDEVLAPCLRCLYMAVVKAQETPGEHQNRWQLDVHPSQNGIAIGYATDGHMGFVLALRCKLHGFQGNDAFSAGLSGILSQRDPQLGDKVLGSGT